MIKLASLLLQVIMVLTASCKLAAFRRTESKSFNYMQGLSIAGIAQYIPGS